MFKVSVIIPFFNVERFIEKALRSAIQLPEVDEVLLVNDGSIDNSVKIIEAIIVDDKLNKKIKVLSHENNQNKGAAASRNLGIVNAQNKYISFLDADDFYLPTKDKNAGCVLLGSNREIVKCRACDYNDKNNQSRVLLQRFLKLFYIHRVQKYTLSARLKNIWNP